MSRKRCKPGTDTEPFSDKGLFRNSPLWGNMPSIAALPEGNARILAPQPGRFAAGGLAVYNGG